MKIVKLTHGYAPSLWHFIMENLPRSLIATKRADGYGHVFGVRINQNTFGGHVRAALPIFFDEIATVTDDVLELRQPQYYSDFEDLIRKYETQTRKEVEFRFWGAS